MTTTENKTLDILAIKSLLPHRYPLLLVDRVLTLGGEQNDHRHQERDGQ